jgi:hypothetical protein
MGLEAIEGAIRFAEEAGVCFWNAELLRLKGHCWRACRHAQKWRFLTGKLWPWCDISRPGRLSCALLSASPASGAIRVSGMRPCELLAPIYGWFTEGFDTLDLKEAKALLDELSA